ncbi:Mu transposase C-terminal domain-containing protein [Leisingera sp.]|uniref:Mu transposase C-terminal domain-containing protein n=1 Tax=Leisingera sp. TaxID=1879318 RepID=UPI002B265BA2|nr:Mu transposase C-terminal domain-containing protein [Leisingera sp.]
MTPAKAWEKARKECPPRSLTSAEMREVFGVRARRKLSRKGVRVRHIDYQSDALMTMFLREKVDDVEILRWDGDIGAISIRADSGPWLTVPACNEKWIGKTDFDLIAELAEEADEDDVEKRKRRNWINSANRESYRLKRLLGLITLPKTTDDLNYETQRFMRHADTTERRRKAGKHRDLMGDLDDAPDTDTASYSDQSDTTPTSSPKFSKEGSRHSETPIGQESDPSLSTSPPWSPRKPPPEHVSQIWRSSPLRRAFPF